MFYRGLSDIQKNIKNYFKHLPPLDIVKID